jgi:hypothetical protein
MAQAMASENDAGREVYPRGGTRERFVEALSEYAFPLSKGVGVVGWPAMYHIVLEKHAGTDYGDTARSGAEFVVLFLTEFVRFLGIDKDASTAIGRIFATLLYVIDVQSALSRAIAIGDGAHRFRDEVLEVVKYCLVHTRAAIIPAPLVGAAPHQRAVVMRSTREGKVHTVIVVDAGGASSQALSYYRAVPSRDVGSLFDALYVNVSKWAHSSTYDGTQHLHKTLKGIGFELLSNDKHDFQAEMQQSGGCSVVAPWLASLVCLTQLKLREKRSLSPAAKVLLVERARLFVSTACTRLALMQCLEGNGLEYAAGRTTLGMLIRATPLDVRMTFSAGAAPMTARQYAAAVIKRMDVGGLRRLLMSGSASGLTRTTDGHAREHITRAFGEVYPNAYLRPGFTLQATPAPEQNRVPDYDRYYWGSSTQDGRGKAESPRYPPLAASASGPAVWGSAKGGFVPNEALTMRELFSAIFVEADVVVRSFEHKESCDCGLPYHLAEWTRFTNLVTAAVQRTIAGESLADVAWQEVRRVGEVFGKLGRQLYEPEVVRRGVLLFPGAAEAAAGFVYCIVKANEAKLRSLPDDGPKSVTHIDPRFYASIRTLMRPVHHELLWLPDGETVFPTRTVMEYLDGHLELFLPVYQTVYGASQLLSPRGIPIDVKCLSDCMAAVCPVANETAFSKNRFNVTKEGLRDFLDQVEHTTNTTSNHIEAIDLLAKDVPRTRATEESLKGLEQRLSPLLAYTELPYGENVADSQRTYVEGSDAGSVEDYVSLGERCVRDVARTYTGSAWLERASKRVDIAPPRLALTLLVSAYVAGWKNLAGAAGSQLLAHPDAFFDQPVKVLVARHIAAVARGAVSGDHRPIHATAHEMMRDPSRRNDPHWMSSVIAYRAFVSTACTWSEFLELRLSNMPSRGRNELATLVSDVLARRDVLVFMAITKDGPFPFQEERSQAAPGPAAALLKKKRMSSHRCFCPCGRATARG